MGYRYIALISGSASGGDRLQAIELKLRKSGLQRRLASGSFHLFAARETPTLLLDDGGILIGHLFAREGSPVTDGSQIPTFSSNAQLRKHLIENFWGDYLLFQRAKPDECGLTVTRDPSGGVPCIYFLQNGAGFITSNISIVASTNLYEKRIDWDYITSNLTYPHQKTTRTGLVDINELLPGCTLKLTSVGPTTEQDWSPWSFVVSERRHTDPREATADVRATVASAVRAWAKVDRSVLVEVSGGLDSSIVAACLRNTQARVACCTLVTPLPGADERQYARLIATGLGVELQTRLLDFEDMRLSFIPPWSTVSPRIGSLQYAIDRVMSAAGGCRHVASVFTGAGGDTVFCYLTNAAPAADAFRERGLSAGLSAIRDLSTLHQCTLWTAASLTLKKLLHAPKGARSPHRAFVDPSIVAGAPESHPWFDAPEDALPGDLERVFGLVDTQLYRDSAPCGAGRWLRMPLLAQPVVEACLRTPSWMWISGGQNRAIARTAFADLLPPDILYRRSKGNFLAYLGGFYRRNRGRIRDFLLSGQLHERHLLNAPALGHFLDRGDLPTRDRLFLEVLDLCMIENWLHHQR